MTVSSTAIKLVEKRTHCSYLRPTIVHCSDLTENVASPKRSTCTPSSTVVECPRSRDAAPSIGPTLVGTMHHAIPEKLISAAYCMLRDIDRREHRPRFRRIEAELAAATRGQHHRLPVPLAGLPGRRFTGRRNGLELCGLVAGHGRRPRRGRRLCVSRTCARESSNSDLKGSGTRQEFRRYLSSPKVLTTSASTSPPRCSQGTALPDRFSRVSGLA